jgi:AtzE family amidohydrolase
VTQDPLGEHADATTIAGAVRDRRIGVAEVVDRVLGRIASRDAKLNAFTAVCADRAREAARRLDASFARGEPAGPLAGVAFAVKAQIDVAGITTTAGSKLHVDDPPAKRDAVAVARLERAGAICVGVTNMDEFGMGGTTENRHFGPARNPHDLTRTPGGSSGGSAAAVAGGLVPIALGSDALGSVRLPASLCGVYGLRPTRGAVPGDGLLPPPGSISTIGPVGRTVADLAACFEAIADPPRHADDMIAGHDVARLRIGVVGGFFRRNLSSEGAEVLERAAKTFPGAVEIDLPEAALARSAAVLVNASESAGPQLERLRTRPDDFDPSTRDRFLAHALLPAAWYLRAQAFRRWHKSAVLRLLRECPVMLLPAAPCVAPRIGTRTLVIDGVEQPIGPSLGLYTQPLAALDCPVLSVPIAREGLPVGVQLLAAPGNERLLFAVAAHLEQCGVARATIPPATH